MDRYDKILGSLTAAAIGDAMGAPVESRPVYLIREENNGYVFDYKDMNRPDLPPAEFPLGVISDDFSISHAHAVRYAENGGIDSESTIKAINDWIDDPKYTKFSSRFIGPTTMIGLSKLNGTYVPDWPEELPCNQRTITNGGAMKSWVCGLFNPGNLDKAINDALTMCIITHDNIIALSAAAAVSAAVAQAMCDTTLDKIIEAGVYGARVGMDKAKVIARHAAGASVEKRIHLAVEIGIKYSNDFEKCIIEMSDLIGTGLFANEAVPSAFGFLAATGGDPMETIFRAINAGNDTDTVACIAGSMAGAFKGIDAIPSHHLPFLEKANNIDIVSVAKNINSLL